MMTSSSPGARSDRPLAVIVPPFASTNSFAMNKPSPVPSPFFVAELVYLPNTVVWSAPVSPGPSSAMTIWQQSSRSRFAISSECTCSRALLEEARPMRNGPGCFRRRLIRPASYGSSLTREVEARSLIGSRRPPSRIAFCFPASFWRTCLACRKRALAPSVARRKG